MTRRMGDELSVLLGDRIRQERLRQGLGQEDLALDLRISTQAICYYEKGRNRISLERYLAMCKTLGMDPFAVLAEVLDGLPGYAWVREQRSHE
jgi:transcriptional regulator with XRE-family HTH domain